MAKKIEEKRFRKEGKVKRKTKLRRKTRSRRMCTTKKRSISFFFLFFFFPGHQPGVDCDCGGERRTGERGERGRVRKRLRGGGRGA